MLKKALLLCFTTLIVGCQTTPSGSTPEGYTQWHKNIDQFYQQDGESTLVPYVKSVRYFDAVSETEICKPENLNKIEQALALNPSSLFAYTVKFECASRQQDEKMAQIYRQNVSAIAEAITRGRKGEHAKDAIEIREIDEAYILLELSGSFAFGYEIEPLRDSFVYKFHVFDMDENRFHTRYFDNSRFLGKMYSDLNNQDLDKSQITVLTLSSLKEERSESVLIPMARYQMKKRNYQKAIEILTQIEWPSAIVDTMLFDVYHKTGQLDLVDNNVARIKEHSINGYADASIFLAAFELVQGQADPKVIQDLLLEVDNTTQVDRGAFLLAKSLSGFEEPEPLLRQWLNQQNNINYWQQLTFVAEQIREETGGHKIELVLLKLAAEKGSSEAFRQLAKLYRDGRFVTKDITKAELYLQRAAESGNADAQLDLGYYYDTGGLGLKRDLKSAFYWYQQAAKQGQAIAHHNLGLFYDSGTFVKRNINQAIYHFEQAIRLGYNESYCALGDIYTANPEILGLEKSLEFYQIGAKAGATVCMYNLGYTYSNTLKNYTKALQWYQRAADNGSSGALNNLGRMYEFGQGVTKDYDKAFNYYQRAAQNNNASAITNLGLFYSRGWGVEKDRQKALELYRQAEALKNYASAFNLGNAYYYGDGVSKDWQSAADFYQKSADYGYPFALCIAGMVNRENKQNDLAFTQLKKGASEGIPRCQWELGVLFESEQNYTEAKYWYEQAAKANDTDAYNALGLLYESGLLGEVDYTNALNNYKKAADLGNATSQANLGFMYEAGQGVEVNKKLAFKYYLMSAEQGDGQGLNNAATFYFHGITVKQDREKGLALYRQAAAKNNKFALNNLGKAYRDGKGVEVDHKVALAYFERSLAQGFTAAYEAAGLMHYRGQGTKKDDIKAAEYLQVASERGLEVASYFLGEIYFESDSGLNDIHKSIDFFTLSFEQGDRDAPHFLAEIYNKALSVERDTEKARQWYEKAVAQKNTHSYKPLAAIYWEAGQRENALELMKEYAELENENFNFVMGVYFHFSNYVKPDFALALHYYQLGAEAGDSGSINNLAELYRFGNDLDIDYDKAIKLYRRAQQMGSVHATFNLAEMHRDGHGFEVNMTKAFNLFNRAAQEGFSDAMYQLALMYQKGKGTVANSELAKQWLKRSADNGFQPAIDYLNQSESQVR